MSQYDEHEQPSKRRGRDGEEIDRNNLLSMGFAPMPTSAA
jgi:hypothetical protein